MAFKDLEKYYYKTKKNYLSTLKLLEEFDKEHKDGVIEDEYFNKFKKNLDRLKDTYDIVCCFFTLWYRPSPEEKTRLDSLESGETYNYIGDRDADKMLHEQEELINDIKEYLESSKKDEKDKR